MVNVYILVIINLLGGQPAQVIMQNGTVCSSAATTINAGTAAKAYCVSGQA